MTSNWEHIDDEACHRFQFSLEQVGQRWSPAILLALARGANRFSEVIASVPGLSDRMLAQRLRELERAELVAREVIATTPVQIRYHLTERGLDLMRALQPLVHWGIKWEQPAEVARTAEPALR